MQDNIPIDIQSSKLLDWFISRRHCPKTWPQQITAIREKINSAIQDMPEHKGITKLLTGTYINYFHCVQIIEILKETEADTKSIFGRYGSQRMKDWQEIVRLYEKDNVCLAEAAQILMRNVAYEIPGLKKGLARCEQIQNDCEKKEGDCAKHARDSQEKYLVLCQQLGIEGKNIKKEIGQLITQLPQLYKDVAEQVKSLRKATQYYQSFTKHTIGNDDITVLPLVQYIADHGNPTVYEWRYGEPPLKIEEPFFVIEDDAETTSGESIDFGGSEIDFGTDVELETGDIDWGQIDMLNDAHEAVIDFSVTDDTGIIVQEDGVEGGIARDSEALTLLDYHKTRNTFIDEILELETFLRQRYQEVLSSANRTQFSLSQTDSSDEVSREQLEIMISQVNCVFNSISGVKLKHLSLIRESPRYVDRLASSLQQHLRLAEKMEKNQAATVEKRKASAAEQKRFHPLIKNLIEKTKELQANIEENVSKKYNGRPVHITGGVALI
uniref:EOG090X07S9 n=1 Tax=Evadne anonyx TaxID=141404 RepID=A0A9N6WQ59_9CRUS|nr:EOG090X07S9 [Evadne anonyx]